MRSLSLILLSLSLLIAPLSFAQDTTATQASAATQSSAPAKKAVYKGYSGGMMLHAGYLGGRDAQLSPCPQGMTFGIGGAIKINLWEHLQVGTEGYVSTMPSTVTKQHDVLQPGSYVRNGWGGLLADAYWQCGKIWPYIGATIGGGSRKSLFIFDGSQDDFEREEEATFNKQSYFMIDPFVGFDYLLTQRVHLTFKADALLAIHKQHLLGPTGPRFYVGFLFCH